VPKLGTLHHLVESAIVVLIFAIVWQAVQLPRDVQTGPPHNIPLIRPGTLVDSWATHWNQATRHLVLVVTTSCPACRQSAPLYEALSRRAKDSQDTRLVVVSNEPVDAVRGWLDVNAIQPEEIVQVEDLAEVGVFLVPTLLIVDQKGGVTDVVVGQLSAKQEEELRARVDDPLGSVPLDYSSASSEIDETTLGHLLDTLGPLVVDIRDRDAYEQDPGVATVNIPGQELSARAPIELSRSRPLIVDCSGGVVASCHAAAVHLRNLGFSDVYVYRPSSGL